MTTTELTQAIDEIVADMDAKVNEITALFEKAWKLGVDVPAYTVTRANKSAVKWWKEHKQEWVKKVEKRRAYEAAISNLTKEERKVLGL